MSGSYGAPFGWVDSEDCGHLVEVSRGHFAKPQPWRWGRKRDATVRRTIVADGRSVNRDCLEDPRQIALQDESMTPGLCIFCDIVEGVAPAKFLYRDDHASSFLDTEPVRRGHTLVVPHQHVVDLTTHGAASALAGMAQALHLTAGLLRSRLHADGISVFQSNGLAAGQSVEHIHVHLVPRFVGDGRLTANWSPSTEAQGDIEHVHTLLTAEPDQGG